MTHVQLALTLSEITRNSSAFYIHCRPVSVDFTSAEGASLWIEAAGKAPVALPLNKATIYTILGTLEEVLWRKGLTVIAWDTKPLFSFIRKHTGTTPEVASSLLDLRVIERFLGFQEDQPADFREAMARTQRAVKDGNWAKAKDIYQKIHLPLITKVLPGIETLGVLDAEKRQRVYSFYEVEGQSHGRLKCDKSLAQGFNPHSLSEDERRRLRPDQGDVFMSFDYRHMEVSVLQWLTGDEHLTEILELDVDLYRVIYKLVVGSDCDSDKKRDLCKLFFLPVVYGQGAASLSERLGISLATAEKIIDRIHNLFPTAMRWIQKQQQHCNVVCYDYFGRRGHFTERQHRVRNFVVQAPAAVVCLEKLIDLYEALHGYGKVVCHIHDGYVFSTGRHCQRAAADIAGEVLRAESKLCPGLRLRAGGKVGPNLADMVAIGSQERNEHA